EMQKQLHCCCNRSAESAIKTKVKGLSEELGLDWDHTSRCCAPILAEHSNNLTRKTNPPAQATKLGRATKPLLIF
ncbi:MAG: hypothetical protein WAR24_17365, partial [Candidatus Acidiferrales bacterium]